MTEPYPREIEFERILNFRDLGGYRTEDGLTVAWRRVFRSGTLHGMTAADLARLKELGLNTVIDLRSEPEIRRRGQDMLAQAGFRHHNIPFVPDDEFAGSPVPGFEGFSSMGEFYAHLIRQKGFGRRVIAALELIARTENHPLVFHCAAGRDRTGILAAILLSALGVSDEDIERDYCLSARHIEALLQRLKCEARMTENLKRLPAFFWQTLPESMKMMLTSLREVYGSVEGYLLRNGAEPSLVIRLRRALLV